jgi:hypothetical protein
MREVTMSQGQQAPSEKSREDFFSKLRDVVESQDLKAFDDLMTEAGEGGYGVIFTKREELQRLKALICSNLAAIIKICDSIINDPKSSAAEIEWAKGKKKKAQEDQKAQGCNPQPVAFL